MNLKKLTLALALGLCSLPMTALAQEEGGEEADSPLTWNFTLASDYVFRGVSQSDREGAVQLGFDYSFGDSGFYVGAWGSNVDFGPGSPDFEIDTYVGWNHDLSDEWNFDLMLTRYNYVGEDSTFGNIDYPELIGVLTWDETIAMTLAYTNDYGNAGIDSTYFGLAGSWEVGNDFSINAGVGYSSFEGGGDYTDWNLGVSRQFGPANIALNYHDTDVSGPRLSDGVVLSIGFGN